MLATLNKINKNYQKNNQFLREETNLLKRLSRGEQKAFWSLWLQHQDYLYFRCITWMGGNRKDAEEALSRATIKAWEKLPIHAEKITNPKAWLTRMTHNLCVDIHRERQRQASNVEDIEIVSENENENSTLMLSGQTPDSLMLEEEMEEHIRQAIEILPSRLQEPFVLRFYQEMSYPEIAEKLAISNSNVRKRIQQAREALQRQLREYL